MQIVDREHEWPSRCEVRGQPEEAVQGRERRIGRRRGPVGQVVAAEERRGQPSRPTQDLPPLRLPSPGKSGLEQLADNPERELPLELAAASVEDLHPCFLSPLARGGEEARLADSGAALDQDETPCPVPGGADERTELRELTFALEQIGCCRHSGPFSRAPNPTAFLRGRPHREGVPQWSASPRWTARKGDAMTDLEYPAPREEAVS